MAQSMRRDIGDMLDAIKVQDPNPPSSELSVFGKNIHECGTARMGTDPRKSVLNAFNQVHDVKNVFVTDGAAFVTQGCYEPTLTIMAISVRAADYIVDASKRREL
jgi:choline dehydrogenase-like flavoprotein